MDDVFVLDIMREDMRNDNHAYSQLYLGKSTPSIGNILHDAVLEFSMDETDFLKRFIQSDVAEQIEIWGAGCAFYKRRKQAKSSPKTLRVNAESTFYSAYLLRRCKVFLAISYTLPKISRFEKKFLTFG